MWSCSTPEHPPSVCEVAAVTASPLEVVVGDELSGRVVDVSGRPLDVGPPVVGARRRLCAAEARDLLGPALQPMGIVGDGGVGDDVPDGG